MVARLEALLRPPGAGVEVGIGDDCAVVRGPARGRRLLLKTDCVVEGRHFLAGDPARAIGWKAACRAVSDIAACGGEPRHALVACVLREDKTGRWLDELYRGLDRAGRAYGFDVVGGELAKTDGAAVITVAMTGEVATRELVRRSGGRPGDVLFVTGVLGRSFASGWHLRFRPRLEQARWLVGKFRVRAMMDLSDGLAADLPRLARASGTGFRVDPEAVPRRRGALLAEALGDGEDFELLVAVGPNEVERLVRAWRQRWPGLRLTRIGALAHAGVEEGLVGVAGYDHFA